MTAGAARGPYRGSAEKRAQIVRAALDEFAAGGYEASSLRAIASRIGISHTGLLHYFRTKEELLVAVLTRQQEDERETLARYGSATTVEELAEVFVHAIEAEQRAAALVRLRVSLSAAAVDPAHPAHDFVVRRNTQVTGELATLLSRIQSHGGIGQQIEPYSAAVLILAGLQGLLELWLSDPSLDTSGLMLQLIDRVLQVTRPRA